MTDFIKSKSVLHDIIKSIVNYYPEEIMEICKTIPKVKDSNILNKGHWIFKESRQEQINIEWKQADVVWFYEDADHNAFFVVHEIKTGTYDIEEIYKKYHTGMNVQIWIWAFSKKILETPQENYHKSVRIVPINFIQEFIGSKMKESGERFQEMLKL